MFSAWRIGVVFTAANFTGGAFNSLISQAGAAEGSVNRVSHSMINLRAVGVEALGALGAVAVGVFAKAADAAGQYQTQMTMLQQQLQATPAQMVAIGNQISSLSGGKNRTIFSADDIARSALELQQSGLTASQVSGALKETMYGAEIEGIRKGGKYDPAQFAKYMGGIIKGYGLAEPGREADLNRFVDTYTRAASVSHLDASGMRTYEQRFGATARLNHWSPEDFVNSAAYFSQKGWSASNAGTAMNNILLNSQPTAHMTSHAASARFTSLMMLGELGNPDPSIARRYREVYEEQARAMGMNPAAMNAKQQEALAEAMMRQTVINKATGGGFSAYAQMFAGGLAEYRKKFGVMKDGHMDYAHADVMYQNDLRQAYGIRGANAAMLVAQDNVSGTKVTMSGVNQLTTAEKNQKSLDDRMNELRTQYTQMMHMVGSQVTTILTRIGGISSSGQVIAGGPLDIMTKIMTGITGFLAKVIEFGNQSPRTLAMIGTLIGVGGLAGLVTAAGFAISFVGRLNRSLDHLAITAKVVSDIANGGNPVGALTRGGALAEGEEAVAGGGLLNGAGRFMRRIPVLGDIGAAVGGLMSRLGIGELVGGLGRVAPLLLRFGLVVGEFALEISNVVGWVIAIGSAIAFVVQNPRLIGKWAADIVLFFQHMVVGTINLVKDMVPKILQGIGNMFTSMLSMASAVWNVLKDPSKWGSLISGGAAAVGGALSGWGNQVGSEFGNEYRAGTKGINQTSTSKTSGHVTVNNNVHAPITINSGAGTDPKKLAKQVSDHIEKQTGYTLRSSGGGNNHPYVNGGALVGGTP